MPTPANILTDIGESPTAAYPDVIMLALIVTGVVIAVHFLQAMIGRPRFDRGKSTILTRLIYLGLFVSVIVLAVTSFYAVIAHGAMHGWFLLIHVLAAGAFVGAFALIALLWAVPNLFGRGRPGRATSNDDDDDDDDDAEDALPASRRQRFGGLAKLAFWAMLITGVVTAGTMLLSMLPVFGTDDMLDLIAVHRYAGLALVVAVIIHFYLLVMGRFGRA